MVNLVPLPNVIFLYPPSVTHHKVAEQKLSTGLNQTSWRKRLILKYKYNYLYVHTSLCLFVKGLHYYGYGIYQFLLVNNSINQTHEGGFKLLAQDLTGFKY